jgi:hypothetical protein
MEIMKNIMASLSIGGPILKGVEPGQRTGGTIVPTFN